MPKNDETMTVLTIRLDAAAREALALLATPAGGFAAAPASAIIRTLIVERATALKKGRSK